MKAYTKVISKSEFVDELKKHQKADVFIRGTYAKNINGHFKGCAIGCSIESVSRLKNLNIKDFSAHEKYPELLGIPEWLAFLEDSLFENMSIEKSKTWPVDFAEAINEEADLEKVKIPFIIMLLKHSIGSMERVVFDAEKYPEVTKVIAGSKEAVLEMILCHKEGVDLSAAESAARSARSAAESAAWSAVWSAAWSAAWSAESAARSAESAARSAAWSAESAAWSAAWSAESAARSAARSETYDYYADQLLEMLKNCH